MIGRNFTAYDSNNEMKMVVLPVTILIGIEAVFGLIGNAFILFIYSSKYQLCNFRYFVIAMAAVDLTSCLTTFPGEIFSQLYWYDFKHDWICRMKSFFNVFTAWSSGLLLMCLGFDRYRKICRPLQWQMSHSCTKRICFLCTLLALLVAIPCIILWGKQTYQHNFHGVLINVSICEKASLYADTISPFVYVLAVYAIPFGIMLITTCVLNVLTARKLFCGMKDVSQSHCNTSHNSFDEQNCDQALDREPVDVNELNVRLQTVADSSPRNYSSEFQCLAPENDGVASNGMNGHTGNGIRQEVTLPFHNSDLNLQRHGSATDHAKRSTRKTLIMLILTSVFVITMTLYVVLVSLVSMTDGILRELSDSDKVVFFFFWRLYFINSVINPVLYGLMDPRFRLGLHDILCRFRGTHNNLNAPQLTRR